MTRAESKKIAELEVERNISWNQWKAWKERAEKAEAEIKRMRPVYRAAMSCCRNEPACSAAVGYSAHYERMVCACAIAEKARKRK